MGLLSRISSTFQNGGNLPAVIVQASGNSREAAKGSALDLAAGSTALMTLPRGTDALDTVHAHDPALAQVKDPWLSGREIYRYRADERRNAARKWHVLQHHQGLTRAEAARLVVAEEHRYPHLRKKSGKTTICESNLSKWRQALGVTSAGEPDWQAVHKLKDDYQNCGRKDLRQSHAAFLEIFARVFEHGHKKKWTYAYWEACINARRQGLHPECVPDLARVRRYYKNHVHHGSVELARAGRHDEVTQLRPKLMRDYSGLEPGDCLVADSHSLDMEVQWFDEDKHELQMRRPYLVAIQDVRSTKIVGWLVTVEPVNHHLIAQTLGLAIIECGGVPPAWFYMDNGADYQALGFGSPVVWEGCEHWMLGELNITAKTALPFNPPAKPIERAFRNFAEWFSPLWPTFTGNRAGTRPDSSRDIRKTPENCPTIDDVTMAIGYWLDHYHAKAKPNSRATMGQSPDEVWNARKVTRCALTRQQFMMSLCLPEKEGRVVQDGGTIQFMRGTYRHEALWAMLRETVYIRRPLNMLQRLLICRANGAVICVADRLPTVPYICQTTEEDERLKAGIAENRRLLRGARVLHRDRTGASRSVPPTDALMLLAPDADQEQLAARVSLQVPVTPPRPQLGGPREPEATARPAALSVDAANDVAELASLLASDDHDFETPAATTEQVADARQDDMALLKQLTEDDQW